MKTRTVFTIILAATVTFSSCGQNEKISADLKTEIDSVSYAIGVTFGSSLQMSGLDNINPIALARAIQEIFDGENTILNPDQANELLNDYFIMLQFSDNLAEGEDFLSENRIKEGITTTESGIQYEVITMGDGPKPSPTDEVVVHYTGTLINGMAFDSSVDRGEPARFRLDRVIRGWTEALQLMPVGSKWRIYIPQQLAYGSTPRQGGPIEPYMMLIFEIELLEIISEE